MGDMSARRTIKPYAQNMWISCPCVQTEGTTTWHMTNSEHNKLMLIRRTQSCINSTESAGQIPISTWEQIQ